MGKSRKTKFNVIKDVSFDKSLPKENSSELTDGLKFTFLRFKFDPINIDGEFNNYYKNVDEFNKKMSILIGRALPLLSKEKATIFSSEQQKAKAFHLHRITNKDDIITKILTAYSFPQVVIADILDGGNLYQLEVPYANGATRIVFERIENLISFLFIDTNHHIYFDPQKVKKAGSLSYKYCPEFKDDKCFTNGYCFMKDVLNEDGNKVNESCDNSFEPANNYLD